jgi:starch synthase
MFGAGANLSVRRDVALRLGGFDEALDTGPPLPGGGDLDMLHRVVRHGYPLVYEPRAVVFHRHRRDAEGLRRQFDSWGRALMAFAVKTYRSDPAGRRKLRRLIRWFFTGNLREARHNRRNPALRDAALAELRGGLLGLLGTYGRSQRRTGRLRRALGAPTVAILPWGDVFDDYLDPIGLSMDDFADRMTGGWLFGYVEALRREGIDAVVVCWSAGVRRPTRRIHAPTGCIVWVLPRSRAYQAARSRLADPYAWSRREAIGDASPVSGAIARAAAPFLTATAFALARVLRREGCSVILCQEYEEGRFDVAVCLGRLLRVPVFATFQGGDHTRTTVEKWVRPRSIRAASGLIVAAEGEADRVRDRYGVPRGRIAPIPNPLDPATLPFPPRDAARAALDLASDARVVVWHGVVDIERKGLDVLADAWREVEHTAGRGALLLLLGTGAGASWLRARIDQLALTSVRWRDEYVLDRGLVGTYLAAADLFVLPSRQEGFPVAPVEAMAAGLPIVAADAPGVRAVVGDGDEAAGVIVPVADARALARELCRFLEDASLRNEVGARARERVDERFSVEAVGRQLREFLTARRAR